ncbi:lipase family protein, partial [Streptococcus dentapri]
MITEKNYKELADDVYKVDSGKEKNPVKEGSLVGGDKYQVLKVEDNTANGMQAMAVAPVDKNGNVDTSQVVIAYAGTNSADGKDLDTDLQSVGGGSKKLVSGSDMSVDGLTIADSQFETAMSFAKKIEKEYPKAKITTTGHSLGESLAMYVALHQGYKNVGFNGPDIHNLLSDKEI